MLRALEGIPLSLGAANQPVFDPHAFVFTIVNPLGIPPTKYKLNLDGYTETRSKEDLQFSIQDYNGVGNT